MKIDRKIILGLVVLLLVAVILYFINRSKKERFLSISGEGIILDGNSFTTILEQRGLTDGAQSNGNVISNNDKKLEIQNLQSFGAPFYNVSTKVYTNISKILDDNTAEDGANENFVLEAYTEVNYGGELTIIGKDKTVVDLKCKSFKFYKILDEGINYFDITLSGSTVEKKKKSDNIKESIGVKDVYPLHHEYKVRKTEKNETYLKLTTYVPPDEEFDFSNREDLISVTSSDPVLTKFIKVSDRATSRGASTKEVNFFN